MYHFHKHSAQFSGYNLRYFLLTATDILVQVELFQVPLTVLSNMICSSYTSQF